MENWSPGSIATEFVVNIIIYGSIIGFAALLVYAYFNRTRAASDDDDSEEP